MPRALHVIQAAVYAYVGWELGTRFLPDGVLLGFAAAAQLAVVALADRQSVYARLNLATCALVVLVYARFLTQGLHVYFTFGQMAGDVAVSALGNGLLALPWLFAVPAVGVRTWRVTTAATLLLAAFPLLDLARPYPLWRDGFGEQDAAALATSLADAMWRKMSGEEVAAPDLEDGLLAVVTVWTDGKPGPARCVARDTLPKVFASLSRPEGRAAVVVDVPWRRLPPGWLIPGRDAPVRSACPASPTTMAKSTPSRFVAHGWSATGTDAPGAQFASAMASELGVVRVNAGWADGPELSAEAIRASVRAGAHHLMHGMSPEGRFTYAVKGPNGDVDKGYNYPRHAGTAWFLARAAAALGDEEIGAAADLALDHLVKMTSKLDDGAWYVDDPMRKDGRVWVGTTGLAASAASLRPAHREALIGWTRHVAMAVTDAGQVRNEADDTTGAYFESEYSAYAQGQGVLALALARRTLGDATPQEVVAALDRANQLFASGGYIGSRHPLVVGDEHWTCITAHALADVFGMDDPGVQGAQAICETYVAQYRVVPSPEGWRMHVGGGGGLGEAIIANAYDTRNPRTLALGEGYARVFLKSQFLPGDAPLLGAPDALVGGFRQTVGNLNVQIDVVQHASCALLSWLAVMEGRDAPGLLP